MDNGPVEKSAQERMPVAVVASRAAKEILDNVRRRAEADGLTFEEACARIRQELDGRRRLRRSGQEPPRITPCEG